MLHVAQISFFMDPARRTPAQLLHDWPSLVDVAEAASLGGMRVSVIQACHVEHELTRNGVTYHFLPFGRCAPGMPLPDSFVSLLERLAPDVFHVHGFGFPHDVRALAARVRPLPIVLQDHANRPPRLWRRGAWRGAFGAASGLAFCAAEQAHPFVTAGVLAARAAVYEIPESTCRFTPGAAWMARRALGLDGDPLILWVGHLDANKDPLTVLDGISAAARSLPGLRLVCCFGKAPLLLKVQSRISADPLLHDRVRLLGRVPHEMIEQLMRAADVFVLGSHREGSGYSVIEALACGLPPVVTDIPSYRALTRNGSVGALWPRENPARLCEALLATLQRPASELRRQARAQFECELSFEALGRKLHAMYQDVIERASTRTAAASPSLPRAS